MVVFIFPSSIETELLHQHTNKHTIILLEVYLAGLVKRDRKYLCRDEEGFHAMGFD